MPLMNGWTGGQYSLFRILLGCYLLQHIAFLLPWSADVFSSTGLVPDGAASPLLHLFPNVLAVADSPAVVAMLIVVGLALTLLFVIGFWDRWAALGIWYILACLMGRNPLASNPALAFIGWILLAHAFLPIAPYGSYSARGRIDPDGGWRLPREIFAAGWILMALAYSHTGYLKLISQSWVDGSALARALDSPLARPTFLRAWLLGMPAPALQFATWATAIAALGFAPFSLMRRLRPLLWIVMLALQLSLLAILDVPDFVAGMVFLHLWTFDPAWVSARRSTAPDMLFYDGHCGLCHGTVRFVLAEERSRSEWLFAPLDSEAASAAFSVEERRRLPDSVAVRTARGDILTRSRAVLYILASLGGYWRVAAALGRVVPRAAADVVYDAVAAVRYRIFGRTLDACPVMPAGLRSRFLA
jgi:predicted DCC family thiol-disulfide oxidoreductase YuxK